MKKLFLSLLVLFSAVALQGASTVTVFSAAETNSIFDGSGSVSSVQILNGTGGTLTINLHDAPASEVMPAGDLLKILNGYTIEFASSGLVTNTYTNILGQVENEIFTAQTVTTTVIPATTNLYEQVTAIAIAAGATVTITPASGWAVDEGFVGVSSGALTVTTTYQPFN